MNKEKPYKSEICAVCHVSESEIILLDEFKSYDCGTWQRYENTEKLKKALWTFGLDVQEGWDYQVVQHRNRCGKIVSCGRYSGIERSDEEWLNSGVASKAAKDRAANSRILDDLYALKGQTVTMQKRASEMDAYAYRFQEEEDKKEEACENSNCSPTKKRRRKASKHSLRK